MSRDLAIDLGTANTLVYARGRGIILNEPTVIAMNTRTHEVLALGHDAWQMIGRTPGYIVAVRPLRGGAITDFEITQRLIRMLFQRAGISRLQRARVLICVPSAITHVEQRAVLEAARRAGAAQTFLIEQPMAAAIGASLPIHEPLGNMIVDIGGGTSEVAVISLGGVVALEAVRVGSFDIDAAIQSYVRREYGLAIGERTAEEVKLAIGSVFPTDDEYKAEVRGRDLMSGMPKTIVLTPEEIRDAIDEPIQAILRRGEAGAGAHAARVVAGPPRRGHPPGGRRRDVAGVRPAHRARDRGARPTRRPAPRDGRARRRPLPRVFRPPEGHVHVAPPGEVASVRRALRALLTQLSSLVAAGQVLGGLAHLPVLVVERACERGVDVGTVEGREREHRTPAHRDGVTARGEHGWETSGVPERAERGDGGLACERVPVREHDGRERCDRASVDRTRAEFAERPRGRFHHGHVGVVEHHDQPFADRTRRAHRRRELGGAPADRGGLVVGARLPHDHGAVVTRSHQCAQRRRPHSGIGVRECRDGFVPLRGGGWLPAAERGQVGGTFERTPANTRLTAPAQGSLPLMATTRPAKTVASTRATTKPVATTSAAVRTSAHPRRAALTARSDPGRVP